MRTFLSFFLFLFSLLPATAVNLARTTIVVDADDAPLALKMAQVMADDIERVCGQRPPVRNKIAKGENLIIGTVDHSRLIPQKLAQGLKDKWECFSLTTSGRNLYVVGSDPRGLAYGLFTVSERIGVSPWYWWADVPVRQQKDINVSVNLTSNTPSVKYRGIFINDEDWGLKTWAARNFERELGDIGPKTYDKVCELILRLKGNMLAPAMHSCTGAFYSHPESQKVADEWGIMITTSHCEPLLFNNAAKSEWNKDVDGEWNYLTNKQVIYKKLDDRISQTAQYDNIYTMGMRGLHDEAMKGDTDPKVRARTLEKVFEDQRQILATRKQRPLSQIPQIFVPYKETLDIYNAGLQVPEDVTIVWPDDNYGYMKRVSNPQERKREGGAGVYYHLSYLGTPHDYLWICTTPPVLMYEELMKAYQAGADRYWLLNVGDIKPMELDMQTFFDLAWNVDDFSFDSVNSHQAELLASVFGKQHRQSFQKILDAYYRLAWQRKPEFMGYEIQWDSKENGKLHDTDFSFSDGTAWQRLRSYNEIHELADSIEQSLSEELRTAFFQLLGFSVRGADLMNRKFLYAQLNHETGSAEAAEKAKTAFDGINRLMNEYNTMNGGKWNQMMSQIPPGWVAQYQLMPELSDEPTEAYRLPESQAYKEFRHKVNLNGLKPQSPFSLIKGIGTDWVTLRLGAPDDEQKESIVSMMPHIDIWLHEPLEGDSIHVMISAVPLWPVDQDHDNCFGVSVDGSEPVVCENPIEEWSYPWKLQVLENRKDFVLAFPVDKSKDIHRLSLFIIDPGQLIQKITYQ